MRRATVVATHAYARDLFPIWAASLVWGLSGAFGPLTGWLMTSVP
jgi:hypothetical protein